MRYSTRGGRVVCKGKHLAPIKAGQGGTVTAIHLLLEHAVQAGLLATLEGGKKTTHNSGRGQAGGGEQTLKVCHLAGGRIVAPLEAISLARSANLLDELGGVALKRG